MCRYMIPERSWHRLSTSGYLFTQLCLWLAGVWAEGHFGVEMVVCLPDNFYPFESEVTMNGGYSKYGVDVCGRQKL